MLALIGAVGVAVLGALIGAPLVMMAIFAFGSKEAQGWLAEESRDHRAALEALQTGRFPDSESGRRIAALAARLDPADAERVRAYLTSAMRLTVAAEEKLLGQPIPPAPELLDELETMGSLKAAMGRTGDHPDAAAGIVAFAEKRRPEFRR